MSNVSFISSTSSSLPRMVILPFDLSLIISAPHQWKTVRFPSFLRPLKIFIESERTD